MKKIFTKLMLLGIVAALGSVAACNTVAGAGKDIERGGEAIHDKAKETQNR